MPSRWRLPGVASVAAGGLLAADAGRLATVGRRPQGIADGRGPGRAARIEADRGRCRPTRDRSGSRSGAT